MDLCNSCLRVWTHENGTQMEGTGEREKNAKRGGIGLPWDWSWKQNLPHISLAWLLSLQGRVEMSVGEVPRETRLYQTDGSQHHLPFKITQGGCVCCHTHTHTHTHTYVYTWALVALQCVVSAVQGSESAICIDISPPTPTIPPPRSSQNTGLYSSFPLTIYFACGSGYVSTPILKIQAQGGMGGTWWAQGFLLGS